MSAGNRCSTNDVSGDAPPRFLALVGERRLRAQAGEMPPVIYYQSEAYEAAEEAAVSIELE
jgi:hypothetical protein